MAVLWESPCAAETSQEKKDITTVNVVDKINMRRMCMKTSTQVMV